MGEDVRFWEKNFQQDTLVYLRPVEGKVPEPHWDPTRKPPKRVRAEAKKHDLDLDRPFHRLAYEQQADGKTLSDFANFDVRYQILMNRPAFEHIRAKHLYSRSGQQRAAKRAQHGIATQFPEQAWELKTSWIWIPHDAKGTGYRNIGKHYYVVNAWWNAGSSEKPHYKVGTAAMTAMHITNRILAQYRLIGVQTAFNDSSGRGGNSAEWRGATDPARARSRQGLE